MLSFSSVKYSDINSSQNIEEKTTLLDSYNDISRVYGMYGIPFKKDNSSDFACPALRYAKVCIDAVGRYCARVDSNKRFDGYFYRHCISMIDDIDRKAMGDDDLAVIYLKQSMMLLKKSGIIRIDNGLAAADESLSDGQLYMRLFFTFWNDEPWSGLFPSDPSVADALRENRSVLIDLLLRSDGPIRIDGLLNEFFELTGFSYKDDIVMMSFIDFYFFSWLGNFGIINYTKSGMGEPVRLTLLKPGRNLLRFV